MADHHQETPEFLEDDDPVFKTEEEEEEEEEEGKNPSDHDVIQRESEVESQKRNPGEEEKQENPSVFETQPKEEEETKENTSEDNEVQIEQEEEEADERTIKSSSRGEAEADHKPSGHEISISVGSSSSNSEGNTPSNWVQEVLPFMVDHVILSKNNAQKKVHSAVGRLNALLQQPIDKSKNNAEELTRNKIIFRNLFVDELEPGMTKRSKLEYQLDAMNKIAAATNKAKQSSSSSSSSPTRSDDGHAADKEDPGMEEQQGGPHTHASNELDVSEDPVMTEEFLPFTMDHLVLSKNNVQKKVDSTVGRLNALLQQPIDKSKNYAEDLTRNKIIFRNLIVDELEPGLTKRSKLEYQLDAMKKIAAATNKAKQSSSSSPPTRADDGHAKHNEEPGVEEQHDGYHTRAANEHDVSEDPGMAEQCSSPPTRAADEHDESEERLVEEQRSNPTHAVQNEEAGSMKEQCSSPTPDEQNEDADTKDIS